MTAENGPDIGTSRTWTALWAVIAIGQMAVGYAFCRIEGALHPAATRTEMEEHRVMVVGVFLVFVILLATAILAMLYRQRQIRLYRRLHAAELGKHQAHEALREREDWHRTLIRTAMYGFWLVDQEGRLLEVNETYCRMSGYSAQELLSMNISDLEAAETRQATIVHIRQTMAQGEIRFESLHRRKDGSTFAVEVSAQCRDIEGGRMVAFFQDITGRKQAETYRDMGSEILQILNEPGDMQESIRRVVAIVKTRTGLDAVGLRLKDGDDFPYVAQEGFPEEFLLTENSLLARDPDGGVCRDSAGHVRLECTCGLVLSGKTDPANPLCTRGGSCWTNDAYPLLTLPSDQDPRLNPRNRCIHQGYASVALVPIRGRNGIAGLIQFNDRRKGCFSLAAIEQLEGIAVHVGEAVIRKRMERDLQSRETQLRAILESAADGILAVDQKGKMLHVNQRFVEQWRIPQPLIDRGNNQELLKYVLDQVTDPGAFLKKVQELYLSDARDMDTFTFKDGRVFERYSLPMSMDGKNSGRVWSFRDITARKRAETEKAVRDAQTQRFRKIESLGRMAGGIAHHFNNQLHAVMGNIDLAMCDLPRHTEAFKNLAVAMEAARMAAKVSGQLLTYIGRNHCRREPQDLSETCRRYLPVLLADLPENMLLASDLPAPGPNIDANVNLIQQLITNLITNAWEANGDRHGAIHLNVKTVSTKDIPALNRFPVDCQPDGTAYACMEVVDRGCGISKEDLNNLFDPFFSSKFTGRGMGLAESLGIVRAHHGFITVESEQDRGTTVQAYFPLSPEAASPKPEPAPCVTQSAPAGTVLVVDDTPVVLQLATRTLQNLGFTVLAAVDGVQAVEVFRQHQDEIACVLCDLTMPRMNGWETLEALRKLSPGIPVILASGYCEADVMTDNHPEMPQAFLGKPYGGKALGDVLARVMPTASPDGRADVAHVR